MWRSVHPVIPFTRENRKLWILPDGWINSAENMGRPKTVKLVVAKCKKVIGVVLETYTNECQSVEVV